MKVVLKVSSAYLKSTHVFPTPESPIRRSLKSRSYAFFGGTSPGVDIFKLDWGEPERAPH